MNRRELLLASVGIVTTPWMKANGAIPSGKNKWALLIGVDKYEGSDVVANELRGAGNDALAMANLFASQGFRILLFVNPETAKKYKRRPTLDDPVYQPRRSDIVVALSNLAKRAEAGDHVVVFFAGHGCQDGDSEAGRYLLLADARINDADTVRLTALTLDAFETPLRKLQREKQAQVVVMYDMCRVEMDPAKRDATRPTMNKAFQGSRGGFDFSGVVTPKETPNPVFVSWWSCSPGERAFEHEVATSTGALEWRGYFTYELEKILRQSVTSPLNMLTDRVTGAVSKAVKTDKGESQRPRLRLEIGDSSDLAAIGLFGPVRGKASSNGVKLPARLTFSELPKEAIVRIDGKKVDPKTEYREDIIESTKTIDITVSGVNGFAEYSQSIELLRGKTVRAEITLVKSSELSWADKAPMIAKYISKSGMANISTGNFLMGSNPVDDNKAEEDEKPQRKVTLNAFKIGKTPVTVGMFREYCEISGQSMPEPPEFDEKWEDNNHPMVNVTWDDCIQFCDWVTKISGTNVNLPTEAQWERAARGTSGFIYPYDSKTFNSEKCWGSALPPRTAPVNRSYNNAPSPDGVLDMSGNITQWCLDFYTEKLGTLNSNNPSGPPTGQRRVIRGTGFRSSVAIDFRCANRSSAAPSIKSDSLGFRLVCNE